MKEVRIRSGVVVSAIHPTLGALYWYYSDESSVGGPDYYGLTDRPYRALLMDTGWRTGRHRDHVSMVVRELEDDDWHTNAGQSREQFVDWLRQAHWVDEVALHRAERLADHGYFYEWEEFSPDPPDAGLTSGSFNLALSARFLWMEKRYLERLKFWDQAEEAEHLAIDKVWQLAAVQAWHGGRYGTSTPAFFADAPELAQEYREVFDYWSCRVDGANTDPSS